jgi:hypothetical protein
VFDNDSERKRPGSRWAMCRVHQDDNLINLSFWSRRTMTSRKSLWRTLEVMSRPGAQVSASAVHRRTGVEQVGGYITQQGGQNRKQWPRSTKYAVRRGFCQLPVGIFRVAKGTRRMVPIFLTTIAVGKTGSEELAADAEMAMPEVSVSSERIICNA